LNSYEMMLILRHDATEEARAAVLDRIREIVTSSGGELTKEDEWGKRRFAYEIDHMNEGYYHVLLFDSNTETLDEVTRVLGITDEVVRYMPIRLEHEAVAAPLGGAEEGGEE